MNKDNFIGKVCLMWAFLFITVFGCMGAKKTKAPALEGAPDFAFPKTVASDARKELKKAVNAKDGRASLEALIQVVVAENLISNSNASQGAALIDSVAQLLPQPYSSLGYLLEGRVFTDIYNSSPYLYNNRSIPSEPVPTDVSEWSRDIFSNRVYGLVNKAFENVGDAKNMNISLLKGVVTNMEDAVASDLTVYDFMTIQGIFNLKPFSAGDNNIIPFSSGEGKGSKTTEKNASSLIDTLLSDNLAWHDSKGLSRASASMDNFKLSTSQSDDRVEEIKKLIEKYKDTPFCGGFILNLSNYYSPSEEKDYRYVYDLAGDYLKRYPDSSEASNLRSLMDNMTIVSINCQSPSQVLPQKEFKGEVTLRNLSELYLLAVKVNASLSKGNVRMSDVEKGKVMGSIKVIASDKDFNKPSYITKDFKFPGLESGEYVIVASTSPDKSGIIRDNYADTRLPLLLVSRLSYFKSYNRKETTESNQEIYVVEGENQKPVEGAKVTFTTQWGNKPTTVTRTSDKDGRVSVPKGSNNVTIESGKDILVLSSYASSSSQESKEVINGNLFTDLSIYHPGDSVGFVGVIYKKKDRVLEVAADKDVKVILNDANYQPLDTLSLRSDKFGRVNGKFMLPKSGLLGNWSLQMNDGKNYVAQSYFEVADYKSPTFYVAFDNSEGEKTLGETISLRGEVKTYSGMPVAGAEVKYNVKYLPWRWGRSAANGNANYGGKATTAADGSFTIELPTAGLKGTPYQTGRYQVNVTATNSAGETQGAEPYFFSLGNAYHISADFPERIKASKGEMPKIKVGVYDMLDRPVTKKVYYRLTSEKDSTLIASGEFESGQFPYNINSLNSGRYKCEFSLKDSFGQNEEGDEENGLTSTSFIVWRESDKVPPIQTALWVPENEIIITSKNTYNGKVNVKLGSSYPDSYIYAAYENLDGVQAKKWLKVTDGMIEIPVNTPSDLSRTGIMLSGMRDLKGESALVTLIPEIQTKGLEIKAESFRDRIIPGAREEWKFSFNFDNKAMASLPVMAVMSNKALNALAPFHWAFNPFGRIYWSMPGSIEEPYLGTTSWNCQPEKMKSVNQKGYVWPEWNTYGYSLYGGRGIMVKENGLRIRGTRNMKAAPTEGVMEEEMVFAQAEVAVMADSSSDSMNAKTYQAATAGAMKEEPKAAVVGYGVESSAPSEEVVREVECPLAFFMPNLITDNEGVASINFDAPAFNGTWQLQVMGYTPDLRGAVLTQDAVASKPVMVQMNAPRFARTGDKLSISATIYNNSGEAAPLSGKIEVFNPVTGEKYAFNDASAEEVKAMGSRVISIDFLVPSNIETVGIRVFGAGATSRDGEQTLIPIYPSSTPVVESTTFYLAPGDDNLKLSIPSEHEEATLTLNYTDNPIWECVTALPALITPESGNALTQAQALYGNATASGLLKKYPQLLEALKIFSDPSNSSDSTLVSALNKNAALKVVALNNTPWLRNAQSETLRMQSLIGYGDEAKSKAAIAETIKKLSALQNKDGGWSWCENMPSSEWISTTVLRNFAMLLRNGFLPKDAAKMAEKGLGYVDNETVKDWKRVGAKKYSYLSLLDYLYVRSFFKDAKTSSDFAKIKTASLAEIEKSWKKLGIYEKATAAILLNREGRTNTARLILQSVSEFSSSSKEKGIWFDNLKSGYNGKGSLLTTAQVLEAWSEIEPSSTIVDGLRQWILLSKQTQDWGGGTAAADLVQAILTSGSDWTVPASAPEIYINGVKTSPDKIAALTGSFNLSLTGTKGSVEIVRSASGPAWGGIVSQYVSPISEVKAASVPQLSVEKKIYVITDNSDGTIATQGNLKEGDKVRVTLTLKCDRDLQYVAVTDSRSAALEPADQISGYTSTDGVWYYREVRNSSTNLFIPFLSKGTHVISYDCYVDRDGEYSLGIAEAQSQYAPVITAHSAGTVISVEGGN